MTVEEARRFVGTTPTSGAVQLSLLLALGLEQDARVMEYGAGMLHLARFLLDYLDTPEQYYAIEPNEWLTVAGLTEMHRNDSPVKGIVPFRRWSWAGADNFQPPPTWGDMDVIFAHSVLTHCSDVQLDAFMRGCAKHLARDGTVLCSLLLSEADEHHADWQYPHSRRFSPEQVYTAAHAVGLHPHPAPQILRRFYMAVCPEEYHDWIVIKWA